MNLLYLITNNRLKSQQLRDPTDQN